MNPTDLTVVTEVPRLPPRGRDTHKGTYGRVLVVAGSRGMSGAAILCASAALRGGAGLVFVAVPESIWPIVAAGNPCYLTVPLPEASNEIVEILGQECKAATAAVLGPGLGQGDLAKTAVFAVFVRGGPSLVLDADALTICTTLFADSPGLFPSGDRIPIVITPHPGEFARLIGSDIAHVQANRQALAVQFAREHRLTVVLKGAGTIVTDGRRVYTNTTGNPGMATGGSGDVLGGLIGALMGQGLEPFRAAVLGTYLHGLAGDLARNKLGEVSLIASDLLDWLPAAFVQHQQGTS
jgi:NAD(P)H-hydrate epimerase